MRNAIGREMERETESYRNMKKLYTSLPFTELKNTGSFPKLRFFSWCFILCCSDCIFAFKCSRLDKLRVAVCCAAINIALFGRHSARYIVQKWENIHLCSLCTHKSESYFPFHSIVIQHALTRNTIYNSRERDNKLSLLLRLLFVCTI